MSSKGIPPNALSGRRRKAVTRLDWLESPAAKVARWVIDGLATRGYRILQGFTVAGPHGSAFPGHQP